MSAWLAGAGAGIKSRVGPARGGGKQALREASARLRSGLTCGSPSFLLRAPAPTPQYPLSTLLRLLPLSPPSLSSCPLSLPSSPPFDRRTHEEDVQANRGSNFPQLVSGLREQERAGPPPSAAPGGGGGAAVTGWRQERGARERASVASQPRVPTPAPSISLRGAGSAPGADAEHPREDEARSRPGRAASRGRAAAAGARQELRGRDHGEQRTPRPARTLDQGPRLGAPLFPLLRPPPDRPASTQDR